MQSPADYERLKNQRVLITGGLGFIGSNLAAACVRGGARVTIVDACIEPYGYNLANIEPVKDDVEVIRGDVRDRDLMRRLVPQSELRRPT